MGKSALVISGGIEGIRTALRLAGSGIKVSLIEESPALCGAADGTGTSADALSQMPELLQAAIHPNIDVLTGATVLEVKNGRGFTVQVKRSPRYIKPDACASCGRCERECPVEIVPKSDPQLARRAIHRPNSGLKSVPSAYLIDKKGVPPCTAACPAGVNVQGYIALVSRGKFAEALDLITEAVPFPRVLGRVCSHPCENKCTRARVDKPVSICALKRYVADHNSTESSLKRTQANHLPVPGGPPEVAIIGAGPAGLTAARDLARLGHKSVVYEALPVPGGMITVGMPRFRLPREIRQADINEIIKLGIEIRTSTPIGGDLKLQELKQQYKAVLIATGAHKNRRLGIPGEGLSGVINSVVLLQSLNMKQPITVGSKVVVIGGGYTAIDSARTAIRLHPERVLILYRRSLEEMPANPEEVAEAQDEGVKIEFLVAPARIIGKEGKVAAIECIRMGLGEPDKSGRRRPIPITGSEFTIEADTVIVAVGQRSDLSFLEGDTTLTDGHRYIVTDRLTMVTRVSGIFAAGDVVGETGTMIEAIAEGRRAAVSIDRFLRGEDLSKGRTLEGARAIEVDPEGMYVPPIERQLMPCLEQKDRLGKFEEVDLGFTRDMAIREAQRCLNCAACSECLECERVCELKAIAHKSGAEVLELEVDAIVARDGHIAGLKDWSGVYFLSGNGGSSAVADRVIEDLAGELVVKASEPQAFSSTGTLAALRTGIKAGVFLCRCGGNISQAINMPAIVEYNRTLRGVAWSSDIGYACTGAGAEEIWEIVRKQNLTHVVVAGCACCNLDQICFSCSDRRIQCKLNLLRGNGHVHYEFVNIREHCAWVHNSLPECTQKAKLVIRAGLARATINGVPSDSVAGKNPGHGSIILSPLKGLAVIQDNRCRGCGTCVSTCQFGAITLVEKKPGILCAQLNRSLCSGCGVCIADCPSGALSQEGYEEDRLRASLDSILSG